MRLPRADGLRRGGTRHAISLGRSGLRRRWPVADPSCLPRNDPMPRILMIFHHLLLLAFIAGGPASAATQEGTDPRPVQVDDGTILMPDLNGVPKPLTEVAADLRLPPRFADYRPAFTVEYLTFTLNHVRGPLRKRWRVVRDHGKVVALMLSDEIHLIAFTPDQASERIGMTTGRYHMDRWLGPKIDVHALQVPAGTSPVRSDGALSLEASPEDGVLSPEEMELMFARRDLWTSDGRRLQVERSTEYGAECRIRDRLVFSVDPVLGYRIDAHCELDLAPMIVGQPKVMLKGHVYTPGTYKPWPAEARFSSACFSHPEDPPGRWRGWACNQYGIDHANSQKKQIILSDPGFLAYLAIERDGWSPCLARMDGTGPNHMGQCNAGHGPGFSIPVPLLQPGSDGHRRFQARRTLFALPPELTEHLRSRTRLIDDGKTGLFIRMDESFDDQPLSLTSMVRGLIWTSNPPELIKDGGRAGTPGLRIAGRVWPNLPQVGLESDTRYRLEAWFRIIAWPEERIALERSRSAAAQTKRNTELVAKGRPVPALTDWSSVEPAAWIDGDLYEWSPHTDPMLACHRTTLATPDVSGWQHVQVEFITPSWDPFINLVFNARLCDAVLDDFRLAAIPAPPTKP